MNSTLEHLIQAADGIILGKREVIEQALVCLLARGHLLIEDLPGVGKTTLAHLLARLLGLQYQRIQFTSDLLPADIIGSAIFDREQHGFVFHAGPIFAELILADEINRATPKTQSALLEAMEEGQVTSEGETRPLPKPFFVIATQNPAHQVGTFPLPESQLDRFLMRIRMGYPDRAAEHRLLIGDDRREAALHLQPLVSPAQLRSLQDEAARVRVQPALIEYLQDLLEHSRQLPQLWHGLSPRAGLAILRAARAMALLRERDFVIPEDIQSVFPACVEHRLRLRDDLAFGASAGIAERLLRAVAIP